MATKNLTQNIDNLTGTTGADLFQAQLFTTSTGLQIATLQTGDKLNGGGGTDRLLATILADGNNNTSSYLARPQLTSIETVQITSISNNTGTAGQSNSTLDLLQSTGVQTFISDASNNQVDIVNAGGLATYVVRNSVADDAEDGLVVKGITATTITVKAQNISDSAGTVETLQFDSKSGNALTDMNLSVTSSNVIVDADVAHILALTSGGTNNLSLVDDTVENMIVKGSGALQLQTAGGGDFFFDVKFDASAYSGALTLGVGIEGNFSVLRGSKGDDTFGLIDSGNAGKVSIVLAGGNNTVGQIDATAATALNITSGAGSDAINSVVAMNGPVTISTGSGIDHVTISQLSGTANNVVNMGANSDALDISQITPDLDSSDGFVDTYDGGAGSGSNRIRAILQGLTTDQASHIVNFQTLDLVAGSSGHFSMDDLPSVNKFIAEDGTGTLFFDNVRNGTVLALQGDGFYHVDFGNHDTTANVLGVIVGQAATADNPGPVNQGTVAFPDLFLNEAGSHAVETLNVSSYGGALAPTLDAPAGNFSSSFDDTSSDYNLLRLNNQDGTTTVNITGAEDIQLRTLNTVNSAVTTLNASTLIGALDLTGGFRSGDTFFGFRVSTAGATITGGKGNDFLVGGSGADTFNLSAGGADTILYVHAGDSDLAINQTDTINNFTSNNDKLAFNGTVGATGVFTAGNANVTTVVDGNTNTGDVSLNFLGNASGFGQAQGAVNAFAAVDAQDFGAVFDRTTDTLYLDSDRNGVLNGADMQITLNGAPSAGIIAADLKIA